MANKLHLILAVSGLLVFGALNTLTTKLQFTMSSVGSEGHAKLFQKPWFGTFTMFLGMSAVLIVHFATSRKQGPRDSQDSESKAEPMLGSSTPPPLSEFTAFMYVGIPAMFDLVGSGLMFIGLLFISASIWQMLRGSMIVFGAIISVFALGRKLYTFHWLGVLTCVVGIAAVGASSILNSSSETEDAGSTGVSPHKALLGMGMVVGGQVVTASQMVAEEKLLKDVQLPAMKIVGYEGVWGSLVCIFVVFPLCYLIPGSDNGHFEDTWDSITMVQNDSSLQCLVLIYIFSCATYNCSGMAVTSQLSAVHRTMLEASRTAAIWALDLFVHYGVNDKASFGEAWMPYSWLQLVGFGFLILGQMVYSAQIKVPGCYYPPPMPAASPAAWASPASAFSPVAFPAAEAGNTIVDNVNL